MAANVPAFVRNRVPILGLDLDWKQKEAAVTIENGTSSRGGVLLAELKALVDSFPHLQRTDVIKTLEIVLRGLNVDYESRHSVPQQPQARNVLDSPSPESPVTAHLSDDLQNDHHESTEAR